MKFFKSENKGVTIKLLLTLLKNEARFTVDAF